MIRPPRKALLTAGTRTCGLKLGIEAAVPVTITVDGQSVVIAKKVGLDHKDHFYVFFRLLQAAC